ncbi:MAG: TRAP transporter large permease subunit [Mesorhizobium sp.]|uniref:TRAP transporter large permease n=1 Tax=Mesorhizobium sp. TaxID=1871066 RepID=UPI000FE52046|nr:TRAP transporter large permease subunit [Mesorhizobium sp.]RWI57079.1 MAG: TRAP transporter large permease subunit [Mesorhizobium sp.]
MVDVTADNTQYAPMPLDRCDAAMRSIAAKLAAIGVLGVLIIGIATIVDVVVMRSILNRPFAGFNELLQTLFAVAIASVLAGGLADRSAIRVDILANLLSQRAKLWLTLAGEVLTFVFFVFLAIACYERAALTILINGQTTVLQLPTGMFMMAIAVFVAICIPTQAVVTLVAFRDIVQRHGWKWWPALAMMVVGVAALTAGLWWTVDTWGPALASRPVLLAAVCFLLLWVFVLLLIPVGIAMAVIGTVGAAMMMGWERSSSVAAVETTDLFMSGELALIPLFLMMGAFATTAGLSSDIYRLAQAAIGWMRGGIAMSTITACAGFGALTGSSIATVATVGNVAAPEMRKRGYAPSLSAGAIASGATLGQLIPPSTVIVLYAILVEESIGRLYMAVLGPALLTIVGYLLVIAAMVRVKPSLAPGREPFVLQEFLRAFAGAWVVVLVFASVIGGIYTGFFTAAEAASVGAVATFLAMLLRGKINRHTIWSIASSTTNAVAMIYTVIIGALILTFFFELSGLPTVVVDWVSALPIPPLPTLLVLLLGLIALGTVMDSIAIMMMIASIIAPVVVNLGYDPLWWGVMMIIVVELGVITPPFGLNLFMLKSVSPDLDAKTVYRGIMPFVVADVVKIAILIALPAIALWLPATMR